MIEDYAKHAVVWDWDGFDNTPEYEYWCKYAEQFGNKVLLPMCALGQIGEYMAKKGFHVTAFDVTKEMIDEGQKRFGAINNLSLRVANICDFQFDEKDFDFTFLATQDLHLLSDIESVKKSACVYSFALTKRRMFCYRVNSSGSRILRIPNPDIPSKSTELFR